MARVFIAIDGSNFYHKMKGLGFEHLSRFNYQKFITWLAKKDKIVGACFYIGQIREEPNSMKSKKLKKDQDRLFSHLRKTNILVKTGYILKSDNEYHEKGVDVQIAVDICMKAVRDEYDKLILVSSDTDLLPAIKEAKNFGKKVEYAGFDYNPSFAMIRFSNSRTLLKKEDLELFIKNS